MLGQYIPRYWIYQKYKKNLPVSNIVMTLNTPISDTQLYSNLISNFRIFTTFCLYTQEKKSNSSLLFSDDLQIHWFFFLFFLKRELLLYNKLCHWKRVNNGKKAILFNNAIVWKFLFPSSCSFISRNTTP